MECNVWFAPQVHAEGRVSDDQLLNSYMESISRTASRSKVIWLMNVWLAPQVNAEGSVSDVLLNSYIESISSTSSQLKVIRLMIGAAGTGKTSFLCRLVRRIAREHKKIPKVRFNLYQHLCCCRSVLCQQSCHQNLIGRLMFKQKNTLQMCVFQFVFI